LAYDFGESSQMKRMQLTAEEAAIIEGLRHERAIYNQALEDALQVLKKMSSEQELPQYIFKAILNLRKE